MSGVRLARHYAKGMQERGWDRIQFISSEPVLNIPTEMVHYGVSKAALQGVSGGLERNAKMLSKGDVLIQAGDLLGCRPVRWTMLQTSTTGVGRCPALRGNVIVVIERDAR